jgi:transposase
LNLSLNMKSKLKQKLKQNINLYLKLRLNFKLNQLRLSLNQLKSLRSLKKYNASAETSSCLMLTSVVTVEFPVLW